MSTVLTFFLKNRLIFSIFLFFIVLVSNLEEKMQIKNRLYNSTLYISLSGELDEMCAGFTRNELDALLNATTAKQIVIDLSELDFMDSTGIGVLIGRYKKMKANNIPIFICNPNKHIEKIFQMTGLYEIMPKIS